MKTNKTPTHYFVYTGHGTQTKNKLQKDFKQYLESLNGLLVDANALPHLKSQIVARANELNIANARCTPLKVSFSELHMQKGSFMISGFYFLTFNILAAYHHASL